MLLFCVIIKTPHMKTTLFILLSVLSTHLFAQVNKYTFQKETGQPWELSQYPDAVITNHVVIDDMVTPAKIKIPFPFKFNGQLQDSLGISENGFVWFGATKALDMANVLNPISDLLPNTVAGIIAACASDLHPTNATQINSGIVGTAPMRELIIEWKSTSRLESIRANTAPDTINFHITIYEFMNRIEVAYLHVGLNKVYSTMVQVGLRGTAATDFNARTTSSTGSTWKTTTKATSNTAMCDLSPTHAPEFGDMFVWMPSDATGINEATVHAASIYPNPVKDIVTIELENNQLATVRLLDITGRTLTQQSFQSSCQLNMQHHKPGLYFIQIETPHRTTQTHKIVLE